VELSTPAARFLGLNDRDLLANMRCSSMHNLTAPLVTSGARRGCGYRQPGGAYFAVPLGPGGRSVEELLIDPPVVIEHPACLGLASVGVTLIKRDGVTHVLDVVGREHHPSVASFIDEMRRLGVSRRAPRTLDGMDVAASLVVRITRCSTLGVWRVQSRPDSILMQKRTWRSSVTRGTTTLRRSGLHSAKPRSVAGAEAHFGRRHS
jgi:hypothetical protein